jgi:hypothetical protein
MILLGGVMMHILTDLHPFGIGVIAGRWKPLERETVTDRELEFDISE